MTKKYFLRKSSDHYLGMFGIEKTNNTSNVQTGDELVDLMNAQETH